MAYPSDSGTTYTTKTDGVDIIHAADVNNLQTEVTALKTKVGTDSSATTTTLDYKLGEVTSTDKAVGKTATQTLTNKTLTSPTITGATITTSSINGVTIQTAGSATDFLAANGTYQTGSTSNASTTAKGIVELATSSEITAGTATGGTGAALVVTPDGLAASTPVFNGSGLTGIPRLISASATNSSAVTNTTTETTVATIAIPANTLGTSNGIRFKCNIAPTWTSSNTNDFYIKVKYGGTTIASAAFDTTFGAGTSQSLNIIVDGYLLGAGSTSSQEGALGLMLGSTTSTTISTSSGTSAIDSTTSQNLTVTLQWEFANTAVTATLNSYIVEKVL